MLWREDEINLKADGRGWEKLNQPIITIKKKELKHIITEKSTKYFT